MKKSTSFRLSNEALNALRELSERFGKSQSAILEHLILDRHSVSDQHKNALRRKARMSAALEFHSGEMAAFQSGYSSGWLDFQTRHGNESWIIDIPPDDK